MAIVSSDPGGISGALGVITLEDVIEELIGEVTHTHTLQYTHSLIHSLGNHRRNRRLCGW